MSGRSVTLVYVETAANSNKFYRLIESADGAQCVAEWGRVRSGAKPQSAVYRGYGVYDRKLREKKAKGYVEFDTPVESTSPNALPADRIAASLFGDAAPDVDLARALIACNRHAITDATGGRVTVNADTGAVTTALGPVSRAALVKARTLLDSLVIANPSQRDVERYLTLVPQNVGNLRDMRWVNPSWVAAQRDLLDALDTAVAMSGTSAANIADAPAIPFRHRLTEVSAGEEFDRIDALFQASKNANHGSYGLRLCRVWRCADEQIADWERCRDELRTTRELWHGTSEGNVLSILRTGLICPPRQSEAHNYVGRMFGDGMYFSDQSTKSLNYATGHAPGMRGMGASSAPMMFLADVVTGNECRSRDGESATSLVDRSREGRDSKGRAYDSTIVRGGHVVTRSGYRVVNNEMIVWRSEQITLRYLCEFG